MLKALKYLKPFWKSVIAVIFLIFAQVQLELALPDYMSNIVTNGIQYNGITSPVPEALSTSTYEHMEYFMSDEDITTFENSYKLVEKGNSSYTTNQIYSIITAGRMQRGRVGLLVSPRPGGLWPRCAICPPQVCIIMINGSGEACFWSTGFLYTNMWRIREEVYQNGTVFFRFPFPSGRRGENLSGRCGRQCNRRGD